MVSLTKLNDHSTWLQNSIANYHGMSSTAVACHISLASDIHYYTIGILTKGEAITLKSHCPLTQALI